jgi:hypothetical protein
MIMVTQYEAQNLKRNMKSELNTTRASVWKCAAGIVGVMVLALLGTASDPRRDSGGGSRPAGHLEPVRQHERVAAAGGDDGEKPHHLRNAKQDQ